MKKAAIYIFSALLLTIGCTQEIEKPEYNIPSISSLGSSNSKSKITATSALLLGILNNETSTDSESLSYYFLLSLQEDMSDSVRINAERISHTGMIDSCYAEIDSLTPGTTYYYRFCVANIHHVIQCEIQSFTTEKSITRVTTNSAINIHATHVTLCGSFTAEGNSECYATFILSKDSSFPDSASISHPAILKGDSCYAVIDSLEPNTTYYYKLSIKDEYISKVGDIQSFTTKYSIAKVTTNPATKVLTTSVTLTGSFSAETKCKAEFLISTSKSFSKETTLIKEATILQDSCFAIIDSLIPNTIYHYNLSISDKFASKKGNTQSFTTASTITRVTTNSATEVYSSSALLTGTFEAEPHTECSAKFIVSRQSDLSEAKEFTATIHKDSCYIKLEGLDLNSSYYYALAITDKKNLLAVRGEILQFTTTKSPVLRVTTNPILEATPTTALLTGTFTTEPNTECSAKFLLSKSSNLSGAINITPTVLKDSCYVKLEGLNSNSTFYYALAITDKRTVTTVKGNIQHFVTTDGPITRVTTNPTTQIFANTALITGTFDAKEGSKCTAFFSLSKHSNLSAARNITAVIHDDSCYAELKDLEYGITYYYALNVSESTSATTVRGATISFTTLENDNKAIDLGLSVKWAKYNIGATKPEGYGGFYAWGETAEKDCYLPSTHKYSNVDIGSDISGTKYDVARAKWGGAWRMPTSAEMLELKNKCTWEWTSVNGVNGYQITGPNGNSIFLPASGYRYNTDVDHLGMRGSNGYYWTSTKSGTNNAYNLHFYTSWYGVGENGHNPYDGHNIRAVKDK